MIGVFVKVLNYKFYKTASHKLANYPKPSPHQLYSENDSNRFSQLNGNFSPNPQRQEPNQEQSLHDSTHMMIDMQLQQQFKPFQIYKGKYADNQSLPEINQQIYLPKISLQMVKSTQFQANNPIQDRLVCKKLESLDALCLNIFDGHGGSSLSDYASKKIAELIDNYLEKNLSSNQKKDNEFTLSILKQSLQNAYQQIEQNFYQILDNQFKTGNKEILKIGSCAITAIIYRNYVIIANCGDSQSILVTKDCDELSYFKGNQQLSVNNVDERKRIQRQFQGVDNSVFVKTKYNKTYLKGFLQPTRTLGDYYLKKQRYYNKVAGVIGPFKGPYLSCRPDIKVFTIKKTYRYLILASDGLWDFISKKEILSIINKYNEQRQSLSVSSELLEQQGEGELSFQDLNKTYIEKVSIQNQNSQLIEILKKEVLQKCAKKKGKTLQELCSIPPGERRDYCDDLSIIVFEFDENI